MRDQLHCALTNLEHVDLRPRLPHVDDRNGSIRILWQVTAGEGVVDGDGDALRSEARGIRVALAIERRAATRMVGPWR